VLTHGPLFYMNGINHQKPLQDRIADYAEKRKRQGQTYRKTANELGISESTLYRYRKDRIQTQPSSQTEEKMKRGGKLTQKEQYASKQEIERSRDVAEQSKIGELEGSPVDINRFMDDMPGKNLDVRDLGSSIASEQEWVTGLVEEMEAGSPAQLVLYKYETPVGNEVVTTKPTESGELVETRAFEFLPEDLEQFDPRALADAIFEEIMDWAEISP